MTTAPTVLPDTKLTPVAGAKQKRRSLLRRVFMRGPGMASIIYLAIIVIVSIIAPYITPYDPNAIDLRAVLQPPSLEHLLGTDDLGRDVFSRLLVAGGVSLLATVQAVSVGLLFGVFPGVLSGYLGGWFDAVITRVADVLLSFPSLILALAIVAILGPGLGNAMFAVGIAYAPRFLRIVRGQVLFVRNETFVEAAISTGIPRPKVIWGHMLPNAWPALIIQISFMLGLTLIIESSLSYLGLGVQPPDASWGSMIGGSKAFIETAPWLVLAPGLVIFFTSLAFNTLGDALRDEVTGGRGQ
ncbi:ABC transporter permease [Microbacterium sp. PI-1]|uniref:ABC transporter permease n=1 Tax=Microbacterium sp. PI-1 TaxID=2545631 RepID=UPI001040057C|nr:ABC transporter permease [Microbacterium sp. PI-1]TCJ21950.1 ABC transporter permease [Microbacterium sp. PI-1]